MKYDDIIVSIEDEKQVKDTVGKMMKKAFKWWNKLKESNFWVIFAGVTNIESLYQTHSNSELTRWEFFA